MIKQETVIRYENGIGAKQAGEIVNICMGKKCEIYFEQGNKGVNGKSIMGVISLALKTGDLVTIVCDGEDEQDTINDLVKLLNHK